MRVSAEVDGGLGTTPHADLPLSARDALESGNAAAPTSSLSAAAACGSTSALAGARETAPGQPSAALPAATSQDADAQHSGLPAMVDCLGSGDLADALRITPRASPPPAALAAPPAIAVCHALVIETEGGDVEGVAQRAPTSLLCAQLTILCKQRQPLWPRRSAPMAVPAAPAAVCTSECWFGLCCQPLP